MSPLFPFEVGAAGTRRRSATGRPGSARSPSRIRGERGPALRSLLRDDMAFNTQVARTAGRNGRRPVEQRLSRWMLMAHHRSEGDEFPMTREFLSLMLGVRCAGVTVAAGALQKAGLLRYGNGRMAIADRPGLEAAACDCCGPVRRDFERLLGPVAGS